MYTSPSVSQPFAMSRRKSGRFVRLHIAPWRTPPPIFDRSFQRSIRPFDSVKFVKGTAELPAMHTRFDTHPSLNSIQSVSMECGLSGRRITSLSFTISFQPPIFKTKTQGGKTKRVRRINARREERNYIVV